MGRRRRDSDAELQRLESEMQLLRERQSDLRLKIKQMRSSRGEVSKLEEKLAKQLSTAKWTIQEIEQLDPTWSFLAFYQKVDAKKPTPRGRRPRVAVTSGE